MAKKFFIHFDWVCVHEHYGEIEVGDIVTFPIQLIPISFEEPQVSIKSFEYISDYKYRINGQIIDSDHVLWLLDCGFTGYCSPSTDLTKKGDWISGIFKIVIQAPLYPSIFRDDEQRKLVYRPYRILSILMDTTPFIEDPPGSRSWRPDASRVSHEYIQRTDAMEGDGPASYLLECEIL